MCSSKGNSPTIKIKNIRQKVFLVWFPKGFRYRKWNNIVKKRSALINVNTKNLREAKHARQYNMYERLLFWLKQIRLIVVDVKITYPWIGSGWLSISGRGSDSSAAQRSWCRRWRNRGNTTGALISSCSRQIHDRVVYWCQTWINEYLATLTQE